MQPFTVITSVAAPLPLANVDTDAIFPAQSARTLGRTGLGRYLFGATRYREDGSENPDFVLNKPAYRTATILIAGENFGCGSSREHAPWALLDFGIACVIAPSFADIFHGNCFRNGMLPVRLDPAEVDALIVMSSAASPPELTVSLVDETVTAPGGWRARFSTDPDRREALLNGLDEVGLTLSRLGAIDDYEQKHWAQKPWLRPQ
jgi:3-isopropylmalate/(R)-2-methylmalate dehydratase small subunit